MEGARERETDRETETETETETEGEIQRERERETRSGSESAAHPRLCGSALPLGFALGVMYPDFPLDSTGGFPGTGKRLIQFLVIKMVVINFNNLFSFFENP